MLQQVLKVHASKVALTSTGRLHKIASRKEGRSTRKNPKEEHNVSVRVNFVGPDGPYSNHNIEGIPCPACNRLLTAHTKKEMRQCVRFERQRRGI
jgi:hypothetical protein